jgi:sigma-B regulation protein RsbU (phosphoserine phosphatase)
VDTPADIQVKSRLPLPLNALDEHLALALDAAGFGAWEWDLRAGRVVWDQNLERIYGLAHGTFDGSVETYQAMIHPNDRADAATAAAAARAERRPFETEHRIVRADGTVRWTHGWAQPLFEDGEPVSYIGVVADVTDQRAQVERLKAALAAESAARADAEIAATRYADVAETLQRSLLPPVPAEIPGLDIATAYHPALDGLAVGGDFYDVIRTGRASWALMLGDVCGKGAAAAALTALTRYSARAAAMQGGGPAAVLRQVNDVLRGDVDHEDADSRFATMVFARLRPRGERLEVTFAAAGHPLPFIIGADGSVVTLGTPGTLLGVFPTVEITNAKVTLEAGDTFLVVTDGVLEARDVDDVELGDHVADVLAATAGSSASSIVGALEGATLDWQGGTPHDDIAMVAVRVP